MQKLWSVGAIFLAAVVIIVGIVAINPGEERAAGVAVADDFRVTEPNGTIVEVDLVRRRRPRRSLRGSTTRCGPSMEPRRHR